jgi:hypothetical protein
MAIKTASVEEIMQRMAQRNPSRYASPLQTYMQDQNNRDLVRQRNEQEQQARKATVAAQRAAREKIVAERKAAQAKSAKPKVNNKRGIVWGGDSDCFDELVYSASEGGVWASFMNKSEGTWFFPMSREDAKEWLIDNGNAPGTFFNATGIRELAED